MRPIHRSSSTQKCRFRANVPQRMISRKGHRSVEKQKKGVQERTGQRKLLLRPLLVHPNPRKGKSFDHHKNKVLTARSMHRRRSAADISFARAGMFYARPIKQSKTRRVLVGLPSNRERFQSVLILLYINQDSRRPKPNDECGLARREEIVARTPSVI